MTVTELKQAILDIIKEVYCKEYIGNIKITKLNPGYLITLGLNNNDKPLSIASLLEDNDFLKFFKKEIRNLGLNQNHYFFGYLTLPYHCDIKNTCECNENR